MYKHLHKGMDPKFNKNGIIGLSLFCFPLQSTELLEVLFPWVKEQEWAQS